MVSDWIIYDFWIVLISSLTSNYVTRSNSRVSYWVIWFTLSNLVSYALTLHDVFYVQGSRQCNSVKTSSHHELYIWSIYIKLSQHHLQRWDKGRKSVLVHMWKNHLQYNFDKILYLRIRYSIMHPNFYKNILFFYSQNSLLL